MYPNFYRFLLFLLIQLHFINAKYSWKLSDAWSSCSEPCGPGFEYQKAACVRQAAQKSVVYADNYCENKERPVNRRECNYGDCSSSYRWQVSDYSHCSQTCGLLGFTTREVNCVYVEKNNLTQIIDPEEESQHCDMKLKPKDRDVCNRRDCDPVMKPSEWTKCLQDDPCQPGKQTREMECVQVKMNGTAVKIGKHNCLNHNLKTWRECWNPTDKECLKKNEPEISQDSITVVQMKRNQDLELSVGQHAFIIPFTNITVKCPTKHFAKQDLVWYHESHGKKVYVGKSTERIKVDKEGRLLIDNFQPIDRGQWKCQADKTEASITLSQRTVAEGFMDWLKRTKLWNNEDMLNEDPKTAYRNQVIVQWVEGSWSECKAECGEKANQTRLVRCEKVQTRVYEVLADAECESRGLPKPLSTRECQTAVECPRLEFEPDSAGCTNQCIKPGLAKKSGMRKCFIGTREVKMDKCTEQIQTQHLCDNPLCNLKWQTGNWSSCSKSCGENAFKSRRIQCVWDHTNESAQALCMNYKLPIPNAIMPCETIPCRLECRNLMANCEQKKDLCRFSMFQYYCCKTCKGIKEKNALPAESDNQQIFTQEKIEN